MMVSMTKRIKQWDRPAWLSGLSNAALLLELEDGARCS
jgi:hypothetical protein